MVVNTLVESSNVCERDIPSTLLERRILELVPSLFGCETSRPEDRLIGNEVSLDTLTHWFDECLEDNTVFQTKKHGGTCCKPGLRDGYHGTAARFVVPSRDLCSQGRRKPIGDASRNLVIFPRRKHIVRPSDAAQCRLQIVAF